MSSIKRRLSQVLQALKENYVVDTLQGGFPVHQVMSIPHAPHAPSATLIVGATTLDPEQPTVLLPGDYDDPDCFRTLSVSGNQNDVYASIVILGKDWAGQTVQETILASGTMTADGNLPFKTIDKITFPAKSANGQTVSVGVTNKLGFYRPPALDGVVERLTVAGSHQFNPTVDVDNGTIAVNDLNGFNHVEIDYYTETF